MERFILGDRELQKVKDQNNLSFDNLINLLYLLFFLKLIRNKN